MSSQPSPSASKNATPDPMVSGSHFFPVRPELWTKRMPAAAVTSVNLTGSLGGGTGINNAAPDNRVTNVIVNRLPFIVILRAQEPWLGGERLRCFIGFESQEKFLFAIRLVHLTEPPVAQHQVVMRLDILRIDVQGFLE